MVRANRMPKKCQQAFTEYKARIGTWIENHITYDPESCLDGRIARDMACTDLKSNVNAAIFGNFMHKTIGAESNRLGDELYYLHAALKKDLERKEGGYKGARATKLIMNIVNNAGGKGGACGGRKNGGKN